MGKILISADSACDLFPDLYTQFNIHIIPLSINMEGKSYLDGIEIKPDDIYASVLRCKRIPATSAPAPGTFYMAWKPYIQQGYEIVHLSMNSRFSCSYQNAKIAAQELLGVSVIDTKSISTAMGLLILQAVRMRDEGASAQEITQCVRKMRKRLRTEFLLDTLEYAHKGGRCSVLQMFGANLLRLHPCLKLNERGELSVSKKFRGSFSLAAMEYTRYMLDFPHIDGKRVFVSHTGISAPVLDRVTEQVKASGMFQEVLVTRSGCAISCHGGPNTLAVFYMTTAEESE